jgi:hypothetical protein
MARLSPSAGINKTGLWVQLSGYGRGEGFWKRRYLLRWGRQTS